MTGGGRRPAPATMFFNTILGHAGGKQDGGRPIEGHGRPDLRRRARSGRVGLERWPRQPATQRAALCPLSQRHARNRPAIARRAKRMLLDRGPARAWNMPEGPRG